MEVYFANKNCNKFRKINLTTQKPHVTNNRPHSAMKAAEIDLKDKIKITFKGLVVPRVKANPNLFLANLDTLLMNNRPMNLDLFDDMQNKNEKKRTDYVMVSEIAGLNNKSVISTKNIDKPNDKDDIMIPIVPAFLSPLSPTSPVSPPMRSNVPFDPDLHANWTNPQNNGASFGSTNTLPLSRPHSLQNSTGYSIVDELVNLTGMDYSKASRYLQKHGSVEKAYTTFNHQKASVQQFVRRERVSQNQAEFLLQSSNYNMLEATNLFRQMRR